MLAKQSEITAYVDSFKRGTYLTYKKGEYIIRPGEAPSAVYYIEKGLVKAYDITKYGEENLLIIRKEHEIFPLIWAITGQERDIIYQALGPTAVWRLDRQKYLEYLQNPKNPLSPLLDMTIEMYRIHSERIITLEYRSIRERLISFLLLNIPRFGVETKHGTLINVPLRQQDIASSINASREQTGQNLKWLENKGLVSVKSFFVTLKDVEKLRSFL